MRLTVLSMLLRLLLFLRSSFGQYFENNDNALPEIYMDAAEIVKHHGYSFEEHWVTTKDGYILYLLRIPPTENPTKENGPVALLQHGIMNSCDLFLLGKRENNLPFVLADKGVDVWLGNNRGTRYSMNHTTLNPYRSKFWAFSLNEMVDYDLKSMIDYVTEKTNSDQIYYAGVSQGSALGFANFGEDEKLASKVKHFLAIAPIAQVANTETFLKRMVPFAAEMKWFSIVFHHGQLVFPKRVQRAASDFFCKGPGRIFCENAYFALVGADKEQLDESRIGMIMARLHDSTSMNILLHWAQMARDGKFQKFDFGSMRNRQIYSQNTPPLYAPSKVKIPVTIFRGGRDLFCDEKDVGWLIQQLPNLKDTIKIDYYNHLDMILAKNAKDAIYPKIVDIITGKK